MFEKLKNYLDKTNPVLIYLSNGTSISANSIDKEIGDFIQITGYYTYDSGIRSDLSDLLININQIAFIHLDSREKF